MFEAALSRWPVSRLGLKQGLGGLQGVGLHHFRGFGHEPEGLTEATGMVLQGFRLGVSLFEGC